MHDFLYEMKVFQKINTLSYFLGIIIFTLHVVWSKFILPTHGLKSDILSTAFQSINFH